MTQNRFLHWLGRLLRVLVTLAIAAAAIVLVVLLWQLYMLDPWTRDGRVRVEIVDIAPEVAGTVVKVAVHDNQFVKKGDVLFEIDPLRFRLAVDEAAASVASARLSMELRAADAKRRANTGGAVSAEEREQYRVQAAIAAAEYDRLVAARDVARVNLARSVLYSPANGYATNVRLRVGDYLQIGAHAIAVIDTDTFWVDAYFEETKLAGVRPGDHAAVKLMGYDTWLKGRVQSIAGGITNPNARSSGQGLQDVNPMFTWVRLAQRIPVRIGFEEVPEGIKLAAGMTASVAAGSMAEPGDSLGDRIRRWFQANL